MLSSFTSTIYLVAQWMNAILTCRTTPAHRRLLATKTLRGKMKPDKRTGELPTHASQVTAAIGLSVATLERAVSSLASWPYD